MCFSTLAVLSIIENFLQLVTYKWSGEKEEGSGKRFFEGVVMFLLGIATIIILFQLGGLSESFAYKEYIDDEGEVQEELEIKWYDADPIPFDQLEAEGRFSKFAMQDFSIGIENLYTFIFAINLVFEGLSKSVYESGRCTKDNNNCFNITQAVLYTGILIYQIYLIIVVGGGAELDFENPAMVFYITLVLDAAVNLVVTIIVLKACKEMYCK